MSMSACEVTRVDDSKIDESTRRNEGILTAWDFSVLRTEQSSE